MQHRQNCNQFLTGTKTLLLEDARNGPRGRGQGAGPPLAGVGCNLMVFAMTSDQAGANTSSHRSRSRDQWPVVSDTGGETLDLKNRNTTITFLGNGSPHTFFIF